MLGMRFAHRGLQGLVLVIGAAASHILRSPDQPFHDQNAAACQPYCSPVLRCIQSY